MEKLRYKIAELNVEILHYGERLKKQAEPYLFNFDGEPDIKIELKKEKIEQYLSTHPNLTFDECEYILVGFLFYNKILKFNGILVHSSAVVYKHKAYLFTAPSGTGKSTHTSLWLENLKDAYILNDDKPAVRVIDGEIFAYGTPFSGKNDISRNEKVTLGGIVYVTRGSENHIFKVNTPQAINILIWQTVKFRSQKTAEYALNVISKILSKIKIKQLCCNVSKEAFITSFEDLTNEKYDGTV